MTPPHSQTLRGSNFARPAVPAWPASSASAPRPAFYLTMIFVFVVYARFPEIMDMVTGSAVHSVRIIMVLALFSAVLFGGAIRAIFSRVGICLLSFTLWLCICTPFSTWRGGSVRMLRDFWVLALFSFVIIASAVQGLEQCRKIMYTLAAATIFIESFTLLLGRIQGGRLALLGGTLGNANYLAMMLLMGVPFCLFVIAHQTWACRSSRWLACMMLFVPATVAATGSRGGLVTLAVMFLLFFLPLPVGQKMVVAIAALILTVIALAWSTRSALDRYRSFFARSGQTRLSESEQSAIESMGLRKELLMSSLQLTMRHPLLGVGPGMFAVANANFVEESQAKPIGTLGMKRIIPLRKYPAKTACPDFFVLSDALVLFQNRDLGRKARPSESCFSHLGHMGFALQLALIAFTGTSIFASNAYAYYFPMLAGLCVALDRACADQASSIRAAIAAGSQSSAAGRSIRAAPARKALAGSRATLGIDRLPDEDVPRRGRDNSRRTACTGRCPSCWPLSAGTILRSDRQFARDRHYGHTGDYQLYGARSKPLHHPSQRK